MKTKFAVPGVALVTLSAVLAAVRAADDKAETKVTLTDMHICCKSCQTAIEKAVAKVPEATCKVDTDSQSTVIIATNQESLQKAVDEILKAGFAGKPDNKEIKIAPIKVSDDKVAKLEIEHVHNCCGKCTEALADVLKEVKGVKSSTLASKKTSFVVEGDFAPSEVVKALVKAGFYPELKKDKDAKEKDEAKKS
jgi:periplasmic mercuric ion binding protein